MAILSKQLFTTLVDPQGQDLSLETLLLAQTATVNPSQPSTVEPSTEQDSQQVDAKKASDGNSPLAQFSAMSFGDSDFTPATYELGSRGLLSSPTALNLSMLPDFSIEALEALLEDIVQARVVDTENDIFLITNSAVSASAEDDAFTTDDALDTTARNLGNLLSNDTGSPDLQVTAVDVSDPYIMLPQMYSMFETLVLVSDNNFSSPDIIARFLIQPDGVLLNESFVGNTDEDAILEITASGEVLLTNNNALDFLPEGEQISFTLSYTAQATGTPESMASVVITIQGTDNRDVLVGFQDLQTIELIEGNNDNDLLFGGTDPSAIAGEKRVADVDVDVAGDDLIVGGLGFTIGVGDYIFNRATIQKAGDDRIIGGFIESELVGDLFRNDGVLVQAGHDSLFGGFEDDILYGDVRGGDGALFGGDDLLNGGDGDDIAAYLSTNPLDFVYDYVGSGTVDFTMEDIGTDAAEGTDSLKDIERVRFDDVLYTLVLGTDDDDLDPNPLVGSINVQNLILGFDGRNTLVGDEAENNGNNSIVYQDDVLISGAGPSTLIGDVGIIRFGNDIVMGDDILVAGNPGAGLLNTFYGDFRFNNGTVEQTGADTFYGSTGDDDYFLDLDPFAQAGTVNNTANDTVVFDVADEIGMDIIWDFNALGEDSGVVKDTLVFTNMGDIDGNQTFDFNDFDLFLFQNGGFVEDQGNDVIIDLYGDGSNTITLKELGANQPDQILTTAQLIQDYNVEVTVA